MELTADQVNQFLVNAVLESQLGEAVRQAVSKQLKELTNTYNNPFDTVIRAEICAAIRKELLQGPNSELIREKVRAEMTSRMTDEAIGVFVGRTFELLTK